MVSVIVSIYNMELYLHQCIDSILSQTYSDYEVLLIDDGSTDSSGQICDSYLDKDNRISVFHKKNGGLSSARNYGIDHAKGEFIVFPDPDDYVEPDYLEVLLETRENSHADLSICGYRSFLIESEENSNFPHSSFSQNGENVKCDDIALNTEEALKYLMHPHFFCGFAWNKLYDLNVIRKHNLRFDEELGMAQDLHFAFRYILLCNIIVYHPEPLYHYRAGGITSLESPLTDRRMSGLITYRKIAQETRKSPYPKLEREAYRSLFDLCLRNIYSYYYGREYNISGAEKDPSVLKTLTETLKASKNSYFPNDAYSFRHRMIARLALVSPWMYYRVLHARRKLNNKVASLGRKS